MLHTTTNQACSDSILCVQSEGLDSETMDRVQSDCTFGLENHLDYQQICPQTLERIVVVTVVQVRASTTPQTHLVT